MKQNKKEKREKTEATVEKLKRSDVISKSPGRCKHDWVEVNATASLIVVVIKLECSVCKKTKTRRDWRD